MTATTKVALKARFETGDIPLESDFEDLIDTIGSATLSVAANDASDASKGRADYVCDGTADDVQIQAAIDNLPSAGGSVILSEGTLNISSTITLDSFTSIVGQGRSSILKATANLDDEIIELSGINVEQITLRGFSIDGNKANQSSGIGILIDNTDGSFTITDAHNRLEDLFVHDCKDDGIKLTGNIANGSGPRETHVIAVEIYRCDGNGYTIEAPDIKMVSCVAGNNGLRGFQIGGNAGAAQLTSCKSFGNGQITAASGQGFRTTSTGLMFVNCQAQDNKDAGFQNRWNDVVMVGCIADSNGQTGTRRPGFEVAGVSGLKRVMWSGCYAWDRNSGESRKQSYGFAVVTAGTPPDYCIAKGSFTYNNYTGSVDDNGGVNNDFTDVSALA